MDFGSQKRPNSGPVCQGEKNLPLFLCLNSKKISEKCPKKSVGFKLECPWWVWYCVNGPDPAREKKKGGVLSRSEPGCRTADIVAINIFPKIFSQKYFPKNIADIVAINIFPKCLPTVSPLSTRVSLSFRTDLVWNQAGANWSQNRKGKWIKKTSQNSCRKASERQKGDTLPSFYFHIQNILPPLHPRQKCALFRGNPIVNSHETPSTPILSGAQLTLLELRSDLEKLNFFVIQLKLHSSQKINHSFLFSSTFTNVSIMYISIQSDNFLEHHDGKYYLI